MSKWRPGPFGVVKTYSCSTFYYSMNIDSRGTSIFKLIDIFVAARMTRMGLIMAWRCLTTWMFALYWRSSLNVRSIYHLKRVWKFLFTGVLYMCYRKGGQRIFHNDQYFNPCRCCLHIIILGCICRAEYTKETMIIPPQHPTYWFTRPSCWLPNLSG